MFSKKILCVGEILWDSLPAGLFLGGAPFNVACHLKMLGHNVKMLSKVGNDTLGEQAIIRAELKGIPLDYIQIDKKYKTGIV
ncbi:MAG: carbohydrate kinase, partial [Ignavibacteriae bacterium]|nr:carbohydrate kinase [Ignavibacteriota bacterium]